MKAILLFPFLLMCFLLFSSLTAVDKNSKRITSTPLRLEDDNKSTYQIGEAFFFNGSVGEYPIELYLWSKTLIIDPAFLEGGEYSWQDLTGIIPDTIFLEGQYWYTKHRKPMAVNGYYLPHKQKLWLNYKNKETFNLTTFDGKKGSGSWSKKSTTLTCSLKAVETANFDWLTHGEALFKDYKFIRTYARGNQTLVEIDQELAGEYFPEILELYSDYVEFNTWKLSFTQVSGAEENTTTCHWQRLVAPVPTLLVLFNEDDGNYNTGATIKLTKAALWTYENSTWKKKELDYLSKYINLYYDETGDDRGYLQTSPNSIIIGEKIWIWNGQQFIPKTK